MVMETYEIIFNIALGLLVCLFGYRIKKVAFFILWFILGYNLMRFFMPTLTGWMPILDSSLWQNLLPIAIGLLFALLGFTIEKICVSGICFCLVMVIGMRYFGTDMLTIALCALVGLIVGALAVRLMKPSIIAISSIVGAYVLTITLFALFPELIVNEKILYFPILAGIAMIGAIFQVTTTKHVN